MPFNNILTLFFLSTFFMFSCHSTKKVYKDDYSSVDSVLIEKIQPKIEEIITYKNQIINPNIKTVLCHKKEDELSLAIINLSG